MLGTNDRCDEKSNNRNNDNRLFNSQNNAAGGYAICPSPMQFYEDTDLFVEWTAQHACGNGQVNPFDANNPSINECQCKDRFMIQIKGCLTR
jgi:hypothetical protein